MKMHEILVIEHEGIKSKIIVDKGWFEMENKFTKLLSKGVRE